MGRRLHHGILATRFLHLVKPLLHGATFRRGLVFRVFYLGFFSTIGITHSRKIPRFFTAKVQKLPDKRNRATFALGSSYADNFQGLRRLTIELCRNMGHSKPHIFYPSITQARLKSCKLRLMQNRNRTLLNRVLDKTRSVYMKPWQSTKNRTSLHLPRIIFHRANLTIVSHNLKHLKPFQKLQKRLFHFIPSKLPGLKNRLVKRGHHSFTH